MPYTACQKWRVGRCHRHRPKRRRPPWSSSGPYRTSCADGITDEDWYAGTTRETKTFNGPGGAVVSRQTHDPWSSPATATRTLNGDTVTARFSRVATTRTYVTLDGGRGERVTRTTTAFDSLGMPVQVDDYGQDGVAGDEQCTKTDYTPRNDTDWLMDKPTGCRPTPSHAPTPAAL